MTEIFHFHMLEGHDGFAMARVREENHEIVVTFSEKYPPSFREEAAAAMADMMNEGVMSSRFRWWRMDDPSIADVRNPKGSFCLATMREMQFFARAVFAAGDRAEAARTGSPSGRAGGVEPPAPAAEE